MSNPRLDKSRHFGTIHPPYHKAMFEQDGHYFGGSGDYLFSQGQDPSRASAGKVKAGAPAPASQPAPSSPAAPTTPPSNPAPHADGPDLVAWAKGEIKLPFFTVKKTVGEAYPNIDTSNAKAIKAGLVEAGVVSSDDVKG